MIKYKKFKSVKKKKKTQHITSIINHNRENQQGHPWDSFTQDSLSGNKIYFSTHEKKIKLTLDT